MVLCILIEYANSTDNTNSTVVDKALTPWLTITLKLLTLWFFSRGSEDWDKAAVFVPIYYLSGK